MVKKTQLRKYTVEKIMSLASTQTNGEHLKMYNEALTEKNNPILQRRQSMLQELAELRVKSEKIFFEMNDGTKDKIQMKEKLVMDKRSRPSSSDIKAIASLFTYLEHQYNLIKRNSHEMQDYSQKLQQAMQTLKSKSIERADPSDLDEQYYQLHQQCSQQEQVREELTKERDANRKHYESISSSIEQYRLEYEFVEERIREKQRELIQLTSYLETRQQQDQSILDELRARNMNLQSELLKAQEILNTNSLRCQGLMIRQIEGIGKSN